MLCSKRIPQQRDTNQKNKYSQDNNNKHDKESHLLYFLIFSEVQKREELKVTCSAAKEYHNKQMPTKDTNTLRMMIIKMTKSHTCFNISFLMWYRRGRNLNDMFCSKRIPQQKDTNQRSKYSQDNNNKNDKESHLLYSLIFSEVQKKEELK